MSAPAEVFISYRKTPERQRYVARIAACLKEYGVTVWWDRKLETGKKWAEELEQRITEAKVVLVLWCDESVASEWVIKEARLAGDKLLPAKLQKAPPPAEFSHLQALDLTDWRGDGTAPSFAQLVFDIEKRLGRRLHAEPDAQRRMREDWKPLLDLTAGVTVTDDWISSRHGSIPRNVVRSIQIKPVLGFANPVLHFVLWLVTAVGLFALPFGAVAWQAFNPETGAVVNGGSGISLLSIAFGLGAAGLGATFGFLLLGAPGCRALATDPEQFEVMQLFKLGCFALAPLFVVGTLITLAGEFTGTSSWPADQPPLIIGLASFLLTLVAIALWAYASSAAFGFLERVSMTLSTISGQKKWSNLSRVDADRIGKIFGLEVKPCAARNTAVRICTAIALAGLSFVLVAIVPWRLPPAEELIGQWRGEEIPSLTEVRMPPEMTSARIYPVSDREIFTVDRLRTLAPLQQVLAIKGRGSEGPMGQSLLGWPDHHRDSNFWRGLPERVRLLISDFPTHWASTIGVASESGGVPMFDTGRSDLVELECQFFARIEARPTTWYAVPRSSAITPNFEAVYANLPAPTGEAWTRQYRDMHEFTGPVRAEDMGYGNGWRTSRSDTGEEVGVINWRARFVVDFRRGAISWTDPEAQRSIARSGRADWPIVAGSNRYACASTHFVRIDGPLDRFGTLTGSTSPDSAAEFHFCALGIDLESKTAVWMPDLVSVSGSGINGSGLGLDAYTAALAAPRTRVDRAQCDVVGSLDQGALVQ